MVKRVHEIWISKNGVTMFLKGAKGWRETLPPDGKLLGTFEAESRFEAFRAYNDFMGWGEWKPPPGVEDVFYTGNDQDDFR